MNSYNETAMLVDCPICDAKIGQTCAMVCPVCGESLCALRAIRAACHSERYETAQAQISADRLNEIERTM